MVNHAVKRRETRTEERLCVKIINGGRLILDDGSKDLIAPNCNGKPSH
jgi:hypothetical protein